MTTISEELSKAIIQSIPKDSSDFNWHNFFHLWYVKSGSPYFFLFKRHLGVTNLQHVELHSLLKTYCTATLSHELDEHLLFSTTAQLKDNIIELMRLVFDSKSEDREIRIRDFANTYADIFRSTVIIDPFYCSCVVFIPPSLKINLNQIVADSGYIHSAGKAVFVRNISKAKQEHLMGNLLEYVTALGTPPKPPIPFIVYAHEEFSDWDGHVEDQIKTGIHQTKMYLEKMNMGPVSLAQILKEIESEPRFEKYLKVPAPNHQADGSIPISPRSLWLVCDRAVSPKNPASTYDAKRYYICYEQVAKNENPFFFFDEDKPAWKAHTTLPHSLTAALLNTTRPHHGSMVICDPFSGTGTTWFEAARISPDSKIRCSDLSEAAVLLARDNLWFFQLDTAHLTLLSARLVELEKNLSERLKKQESSKGQVELDYEVGTDPFSSAEFLLEKLIEEQGPEIQEFDLSKEFVLALEVKDIDTRLMFYLALRAHLRSQSGFKRKAVSLHKAFHKYLTKFIAQLYELIRVRKLIEDKKPYHQDNHSVVQGRYSSAVVSALFTEPAVALPGRLRTEVIALDCRKLEANSVDIILCDPPYGFNTTEAQAELSRLYSEFIDIALSALRPNGHLIMCLPQESYTGRGLPYCTRYRLVLHQVLTKAHRLRRKLYLPASSVPDKAFVPPYYWESERALRRIILHFRVLVEPASGDQ